VPAGPVAHEMVSCANRKIEKRIGIHAHIWR
jgi:hypothetical protein